MLHFLQNLPGGRALRAHIMYPRLKPPDASLRVIADPNLALSSPLLHNTLCRPENQRCVPAFPG